MVPEIEVMLAIENTNLTLLVPDESIAAKITHALLSDVEGWKGPEFEALFLYK